MDAAPPQTNGNAGTHGPADPTTGKATPPSHVPPQIAGWRSGKGSDSRGAGRGRRFWTALIASPVVVALLWSMVAHLTGIAAASLVRFGGAASAEPTGSEPVEFAYMPDDELEQITEIRFADDAPAVETEIEERVPLEIQTQPLVDEGGLLDPTSAGVEIASGGGDVGQSTEALTGASTGDVSFFGVEAQGSRFAYIVDVSGSMRDNDKWLITADELTRSIFSLPGHAEFAVLLFQRESFFVTPRRRWQEAGEEEKRSLRAALGNVGPDGGTDPRPAFKMLYEMRDKPDAIFFMTDGIFPSEVTDHIARLNRRHRIPINTVFFGSTAGNTAATDNMRVIARQSGGRFRHVTTGGTP